MDSVYVDNFQDAEIVCLSPMNCIGYTCTLAVVLSCEEACIAAAAAVPAAVVPAAVAEKG
jgi:hypothetical protein